MHMPKVLPRILWVSAQQQYRMFVDATNSSNGSSSLTFSLPLLIFLCSVFIRFLRWLKHNPAFKINYPLFFARASRRGVERNRSSHRPQAYGLCCYNAYSVISSKKMVYLQLLPNVLTHSINSLQATLICIVSLLSMLSFVSNLVYFFQFENVLYKFTHYNCHYL